MDDLIDLEEDIKNGHYSYTTIGFENQLSKQQPIEMTETIMIDKEYLKQIELVCKELIQSSRNKSAKLKADLLDYFVIILEAYLNSFFFKIINA